jgi:hypothetical protein
MRGSIIYVNLFMQYKVSAYALWGGVGVRGISLAYAPFISRQAHVHNENPTPQVGSYNMVVVADALCAAPSPN